MKIYKNTGGEIIDVVALIEIYYSGKSIKDIAFIFGCSKAQIEKIIYQEIPIKRKRELKYKINEEYFDKIDTSDKAYILGFILADGSMNKAGNGVKIALSFKDIEILEYIKIKLDSESPIKKYTCKEKDYCVIEIFSRKMCNSLKTLGCINNKTEKLKWDTSKIPSNLFRHFIRGFFDGDGHFGYRLHQNKYLKSVVNITTTLEFCNGMSSFFGDILGIKFYMSKRNKKSKSNTRTIEISGNKQVSKFMTWIYQDSNFSLRRKEKKFKDFCVRYNEAMRIRLTRSKQVLI